MRRPAFTLLEVLLSLAIAVLLLSGLYVAVNTQIQLSQSARDVVEQNKLSRTLLSWISRDIRSTLAPVLPNRQQAAASTTATTGGTTTSTTGTTSTTTGTTGTTSTASTTGTTAAASTPTTSSQSAVQFNYGVQGDANRLTLYISRLHRDPRFLPEGASPDEMAASSDLRRVTYWLAGGGDAPLGLARQVVRLVTAEDLMSAVPPDIPDEASHMLAEEVRTLRFSYFDGTSWTDSWDGSQLGADGVSLLGPPVAIEITLGIASARGTGANPDTGIKEFRHFVTIPTANGVTQQTTTSGSP